MLIGISTALSAVEAWSDLHRYNVVADFVSTNRTTTADDLRRAENISLAAGVAYAVGLVAAGVVFLVWLWRARRNAEILCLAPHRRARGWVVWSWICPVVNFWFPFMIVDDIHRASPRTTPGTGSGRSPCREIPPRPRSGPTRSTARSARWRPPEPPC